MSDHPSFITEPAREVVVRWEADVVVCGGGPAGTAAAIAAARQGAKTLLLERYGCLGGLATGGLVIVLPHFTCHGRPVIGGIGREMRDTLIDTGEAVLRGGADRSAFDPEAMKNIGEMFGDSVSLVDDAYDALKEADALVLLTEWREYQFPEFERMGQLMRNPVIFDGRNIWVTYKLGEQGFQYEGVGVLTDHA